MPSNFYRCFKHETCCNEDCSKITKFWANTTSQGHRSGDVEDVQRRSRFVQKAHNWWRIMGVWLWHCNQSPFIRQKHVKFGQMWRFCSLFSSIAMAWCIMNSCHKIVRSIQPWRQSLGIRQKRTELWKNQSWILHHDNASVYTSMFVHEQNCNHASTTVFTGLGPRWPFPLAKTEDTDKRKAFCYDWEDKRKIQTGAVGVTKKRVTEVFSRFGKNAGISG